MPLLCGPLVYAIPEAYSFATITTSATQGTITVSTSSKLDCGAHQATLEVSLQNYPLVVHAKIQFTITITDPCLTTTLTLPTTLQAVSITSMTGVGNTQTFKPATDPVTTFLANLGFCGNRVYTILEASATGIVTITPPAAGLDPFSADWSLTCLSSNLSDVGVKTFTLQAALELYAGVTPAFAQFSVTIIQPCPFTVIKPSSIVDMSISIQDPASTTQTFNPFTDTISELNKDPSFCGQKVYVISDPITSIASPLSNLPDTDPWTIAAFTNALAQVGSHTVTITCNLASYPAVTAASVTFKLTVIDHCVTA